MLAQSRIRQIALAQVSCELFDPKANAAMIIDVLTRSVERGADLVVLPELVSTGYTVDSDRLHEQAESVHQPGPFLSACLQAAAVTDLAVCVGFAERDRSWLYNSVAVIDGAKGLVGTYRKLHLFAGERESFTPGNRGLPIFTLKGMRVGVQVCYDLRFPETVRILALQGAQVVAVPTAWVQGFDPPTTDDAELGQVRGALVQANLSQVFIACADQVGLGDGVHLLGRSILCNPYGEATAGPLSATTPELAVVDLDLDDVTQARHRGPGINPMENRRTDVYGELLGYAPASARLEQGGLA